MRDAPRSLLAFCYRILYCASRRPGSGWAAVSPCKGLSCFSQISELRTKTLSSCKGVIAPDLISLRVLCIISDRLILSLPRKPLVKGVSALIFGTFHVCRRRIGPFYRWFSLPSQLMWPPAPEFRGYPVHLKWSVAGATNHAERCICQVFDISLLNL